MKFSKPLVALSACAFCMPAIGNNPSTERDSAPVSGTSPKTSIADTTHVYDIDEIVVTKAPKDLHKLRDQAVSSTSLSAKDMSNTVTRDLRDAALLVPSFVMPAYGTRYTSSIYVRGIGSRVNSPSVGIYVDDIPMVSKSAFNTHLYDISRIDILRGPNGTLYGQNAEGGLVRIYTKDPSQYYGTELKLGIGSFLQQSAEISHYNSVAGIGSFAVSAFYSGQNGFQNNKGIGQRADKGNEAGARIKFVRQHNERLQLKFIADYQHVNQNGFAYGTLDNGIPADPETNRPNKYRRDMVATGFGLRYNTNAISLNSTTSYQYLSDLMSMDQDYTTTDYLSLSQRQTMNALTEELSVKSNRQGIWQWVTGAFASYQWLRTNAPVGFGNGITQPIGTAIESSIYNGILSGMTSKGMNENAAKAIIERAGGVHMDVAMSVPGMFHTPQANVAVFHESSLAVTPRLTATMGVRYDMSQVSISYNTLATMTMDANIMGVKATNTLTSHLQSSTRSTFNQLLPKIGLTLELGALDNSNGTRHGKTGNIYITASKGYRAGGFNMQMFSDILQTELMANREKAMKGDYDIPHTADDYTNVDNTIAYKPETSWNYELGAHLNLFGNTVFMDAAAYIMTIQNQQLSVMAGTYGYGRMMVNAGRSLSAGAELALRGSALRKALSWSVAYSYTHAEFKRYTDGDNNYSGKQVPFVPSHTLSANADYTILCNGTNIRSITAGAGVSAQGDIYWDEANTYKQNMYALLNAHVRADFKCLYVNIWGKNLSDTRYCTFALDSAASGTKRYFGQRGTPVSFGVDLDIRL